MVCGDMVAVTISSRQDKPLSTQAEPAESIQEAWIRQEQAASNLMIRVGGTWVVSQASSLFSHLDNLSISTSTPVVFDLSALDSLDTAGAWLLYRTAKRLRADGHTVEFTGGTQAQMGLIGQAEDNDIPSDRPEEKQLSVTRFVGEVGESVYGAFYGGVSFLNFFGMILVAVGRVIVNPRRLRMTATIHQIEQIGIRALPLVGLISFLIGVVIAYQAAGVLQEMNADFLTVDMVSFIVLRELGILLAAIIIVGRSGSAFTAQIGAMVMHEEVDAMRALALDPIEILVVPRFIALLIVMPILTFYADMVGMIGAIMVTWAKLGVTPDAFIERMHEIITGWDFGVGLIKAPIFGIIIAMIGCYEGLQVTGSTESVGRQTTKSVVEAIFMILVLDAFFAVFFTEIGI